MKKIYTFFLKWDGGTFISQYMYISLVEAINLWAVNLDMATIAACEESKIKFLMDVENENAVAITGLTSVWCISPSIKRHLALVHIVKTDG